MKTKATQRTLKALRDNGWSACVVEKWVTIPGLPGGGKRIDAFHFGDILAMRPPTDPPVLLKGSIALVQCCPGASHAEHKEKILGIPEFAIWKRAGGRVFLVSWALRGPRGEKKHWTMREEEL